MRVFLVLVLMLVAATSQAKAPFHDEADIVIGFELSTDEGTFAKDGETAAYSTTLYTVLLGIEDNSSAHTIFGTRVRVHADLLFAYQTEDERVDDKDADARLRLSAGTLLSLHQSDSFELSLRNAFEYWVVRPDFDGMAFNFNLGLRGEYKNELSFATFRVLAGYDFKPLWLGVNRLEHVFTVRALLGYVGARATALIGSETNDSGASFDRRELGIAAEVVF